MCTTRPTPSHAASKERFACCCASPTTASISDVSIAASSGHAILDQAAIKAAYAMGKVNWVQSRELILPVVFRLE
jgi:hypothetical protein